VHEKIEEDLIEGMPATVSPDTRVFPFVYKNVVYIRENYDFAAVSYVRYFTCDNEEDSGF
jgi:hypothetical protein